MLKLHAHPLSRLAVAGSATWALLLLAILVVAALVALFLSADDERPVPKGSPSFLVVVSDTLRRDHLGSYNYHRATSPAIDRFGEDATVFERAFAQSPSTKPSIASLFTSRYVREHGVVFNDQVLPEAQETLAEILWAAGYDTAGFVENGVIGEKFGYDQGFATWREDTRRHHAGGDSRIDEWVAEWLQSARERPFFLYVHLVDPHSPYTAPPPFAGMFLGDRDPPPSELRVNDTAPEMVEPLIAAYDEEIRFVDRRFEKLLAAVERAGLMKSTIVVFLSDHGEGFGDHGRLHHSYGAYGELINIPLIIRAPGYLDAGRNQRLTQHIDLMPTLLEMAGIRPPEGARGVSLLQDQPIPYVVSEHLRKGWGRRQLALVRPPWKWVLNLESDVGELYRIDRDPLDQRNLAADARWHDVATELEGVYSREVGMPSLPDGDRIQLDPKTLEMLRRLGYL